MQETQVMPPESTQASTSSNILINRGLLAFPPKKGQLSVLVTKSIGRKVVVYGPLCIYMRR